MLRKLNKRPRLPAEMIVVEEVLKSGKFKFKMKWKVGKRVLRKDSVWTATSIEEMLHAIAAAEMAVEKCDGVKRAIERERR